MSASRNKIVESAQVLFKCAYGAEEAAQAGLSLEIALNLLNAFPTQLVEQAPTKLVEQAYRKAAIKVHPDKVPDKTDQAAIEAATNKCTKVNTARENAINAINEYINEQTYAYAPAKTPRMKQNVRDVVEENRRKQHASEQRAAMDAHAELNRVRQTINNEIIGNWPLSVFDILKQPELTNDEKKTVFDKITLVIKKIYFNKGFENAITTAVIAGVRCYKSRSNPVTFQLPETKERYEYTDAEAATLLNNPQAILESEYLNDFLDTLDDNARKNLKDIFQHQCDLINQDTQMTQQEKKQVITQHTKPFKKFCALVNVDVKTQQVQHSQPIEIEEIEIEAHTPTNTDHTESPASSMPLHMKILIGLAGIATLGLVFVVIGITLGVMAGYDALQRRKSSTVHTEEIIHGRFVGQTNSTEQLVQSKLSEHPVMLRDGAKNAPPQHERKVLSPTEKEALHPGFVENEISLSENTATLFATVPLKSNEHIIVKQELEEVETNETLFSRLSRCCSFGNGR